MRVFLGGGKKLKMCTSFCVLSIEIKFKRRKNIRSFLGVVDNEIYFLLGGGP